MSGSAFGRRQIRDITREELQGFLSRKLGGGLSWETVHHFKCGLSKILGAAEDWGYITENLAQKTKLPRRQYGPAASGTRRLSDTGPGCFAG